MLKSKKMVAMAAYATLGALALSSCSASSDTATQDVLVERTCAAEAFDSLAVDGAEITNIRASHSDSGSIAFTPLPGESPPRSGFCELEVTLTHGENVADGLPADVSHVWVWLPDDWNGRFQAVGGGGTRASHGAKAMTVALDDGYATASSDSGFSLTETVESPQFSGATFNTQLFENWNGRGVHETALLGKAATTAYFGADAEYSYWTGCSNGGRQGLAAAQSYPGDFDGILAVAPAQYGGGMLNMTMSWPAILQNTELGEFIAPCKLELAHQRIMAVCDELDGVADGLLAEPARCDYAPVLEGLSGAETDCGPVSAIEAELIGQIMAGPTTADGEPVGYGYPPGVDLSTSIATAFDGYALKAFAKRDLGFDWTTVTPASLVEEILPELTAFSAPLSTDNPDLGAYFANGGKILSWHGEADGIVPVGQSTHYYDAVRGAVGADISDNYRLFLAPGVGHCAGGYGPVPVDLLPQLVAWVEDGVAPETLRAELKNEAGEIVLERPLCAYPDVVRFNGDDAAEDHVAFSCEAPA